MDEVIVGCFGFSIGSTDDRSFVLLQGDSNIWQLEGVSGGFDDGRQHPFWSQRCFQAAPQLRDDDVRFIALAIEHTVDTVLQAFP